MNVNQLVSKPPTDRMSQTKLPALQPSAISRMEHPLIPLQGAAATALANTHEIFPMPLFNQQLLVPLAAFQTGNEEPLSLVTAHPDSSNSSFNSKPTKPSQSSIQILPQPPAPGMNLVVTTADANSIPLIADSVYSQILNQPLHIQSKSPLNQSISVQYTPNDNVNEKDKTKCPAIIEGLKAESQNDKTLSASDGNFLVHACSVSATDLSNNSCQSQKHKEAAIPTSSGNDIPTELDSESLSKVISSLPPGWKIVGLTHLTNGAQPTPVVETQDNVKYRPNAAMGECASHLPSSSHHRCGVPEVVSVDLNIPTTLSLSADAFSDSLNKKSVNNISLPIDLDVKSQNVSKTSLFSSPKCNQDTIRSSDQLHVKIKKEVDTVVQPEISTENNFDLDIDTMKNEWKVVGLTTSSLPQTPVSEKNRQIPNAPLPLPFLFSSDQGSSAEDRLTNSRSSKAATILNVPTPKLLQQSVKPLSPQRATSLSSNSSDEVRWTIVGVTMANTTSVPGGNDATSISTTKVKSKNSENAKADCTVTNSQMRPVSSSESENAPLSSETSQKGIDSALIEDEWKVIGITHSACENQITPIPPINYQIPVPLAQVQQTSQIASISSPSATKDTKLVSNNSAVTSSSSLSTRLSANSNTLDNAMPFMPSSLLTSPTGQNNDLLEQQQQLLLNLVQNQLHLQFQQQQQEQQQLMMSQIQSQLAFQNQIPFMNSVNEWNLVGLLSNIPPKLIASSGQSEMKDSKKKTIDNPAVDYSSPQKLSKEISVSSSTKMNKNHDSLPSDSKKSRQSRNRDITSKFTKKNTVSHLLKLKRMKMKSEGEDGSLSLSDQEGYEVDKNMKQVKEQMALLSKSDKSIRSRPLHSYAGNRKIFSKSFSPQSDEGKQKICLRSGNQVPMTKIEFNYDDRSESEERKDFSASLNGNTEMYNETSPPVDTRSSARKRKLKIPRKMVADVDYQPFDSSSDSN